jgi:hypothetical protein
LVNLRECAGEGAVGLENTTSGSSFVACSSSALFICYGFALFLLLFTMFDCWLVAASKSHRWKTVAADRVDVPSYVVEELMR